MLSSYLVIENRGPLSHPSSHSTLNTHTRKSVQHQKKTSALLSSDLIMLKQHNYHFSWNLEAYSLQHIFTRKMSLNSETVLCASDFEDQDPK